MNRGTKADGVVVFWHGARSERGQDAKKCGERLAWCQAVEVERVAEPSYVPQSAFSLFSLPGAMRDLTCDSLVTFVGDRDRHRFVSGRSPEADPTVGQRFRWLFNRARARLSLRDAGDLHDRDNAGRAVSPIYIEPHSFRHAVAAAKREAHYPLLDSDTTPPSSSKASLNMTRFRPRRFAPSIARSTRVFRSSRPRR